MTSLSDKLDEILDNYGNWVAYCENPENYGHTPPRKGRVTDQQAKEQILEAILDCLPQLKLAEYTVDGKRCVIDKAMGWNDAIRDIKDRLEGNK